MNYRFLFLKALCCTVILATTHAFAFSQTDVGCLSIEQLIDLYQGDTQQKGEILSPEKWVVVSQEEQKNLLFNEDTLLCKETVWQYTMSFDFMLIKIYEKENYDNMLLVETDKRCFMQIFQQFKEKFSNIKSLPQSNEYFTAFQLSDQLTIEFIETDIDVTTNYKIKIFNLKDIEEQIIAMREWKLAVLEEQKRAKAYILTQLATVDSFIELLYFEDALLIIDSIDTVLPEFEQIIEKKKEEIYTAIKKREIALLMEEGKQLFEQHQLEASKSSYEKVLQLDSSHKYSMNQLELINKMLLVLATRDTMLYDYADFYPDALDFIANNVESIVSKYVNEYKKGEIEGIICIAVDTEGVNCSSFSLSQFSVELFTSDSIREQFKASVDSLIHSPLILPAKKDNILVNAQSSFPLQVHWQTDNLSIRVFQEKLLTKRKIQQEIPLIDSLLGIYGKPSGYYQVRMKEKKLNHRSFSDIVLTNYHFVGPEAMVYSMLFPGVGTMVATQGKKGIGAMSSFIVIGTGTIMSYVFSKKMSAKADTFSPDSEAYKMHKLNSQLLQIGANIGIGICGVIYISDIFHALSRGITNLKESKLMRECMKGSPNIELQTQPLKVDKDLWQK